jgi:hypothetical protein
VQEARAPSRIGASAGLATVLFGGEQDRTGAAARGLLTASSQPRPLACARFAPVIVEEGNSLLEASNPALEAPEPL